MKTAQTSKNPSYTYFSDEKNRRYQLRNHELNFSVYRKILDNNNPNDTALRYNGMSISYQELFRYADKIAGRLWRNGLRPGDAVLAMLEGSVHTVAFLLACSKIGVAMQCYTETTREDIIENVIRNSDSTYFFLMEKAYKKYAMSEYLDLLDGVVVVPYEYNGIDPTYETETETGSNVMKWDVFMSGPVDNVVEVKDGMYPLNIMNTSGSTGKPKGIVHTDYSHVALAKIIEDMHDSWKSGEKIYSMFPIYVATGISLSLLIPLMLGVAVVITKSSTIEDFVDVLENEKPDIVLAPKSMWLNLPAAKDELDLSNLKHLITAGEPIFQTEMDILGEYLKKNGCMSLPDNGYGLSEFNSLVTMTQGKEKSLFSSAGFALPHVIISCFDVAQDKECVYGELGEICCITPASMSKYQLNKAATKEFFFRDEQGNRWGRTGDVGYILESGEVVICCRQKEQFIDENGKTIYPYEIEKIVNTFSGITRSKVLKACLDGKNLLAVHITMDEKPKDIEKLFKEIYNACENAGLPVLPQAFKYRESFPINKGGKMDMVAMSEEKDGFYLIK